MIDFALTKSGDIDMALAYQYPSFTINTYIPATGEKERRFSAFRIDMDTDIHRCDISEHGFKIEFATSFSRQTEESVITKSVSDNQELVQEILIRLKTELGEFSYIDWIGSKLVLERHEDIRSSLTLEHVKQYVEDAIADVEFEEEPIVSVEWVEDPSRFRYETLLITIDTGRTKIYEAAI